MQTRAKQSQDNLHLLAKSRRFNGFAAQVAAFIVTISKLDSFRNNYLINNNDNFSSIAHCVFLLRRQTRNYNPRRSANTRRKKRASSLVASYFMIGAPRSVGVASSAFAALTSHANFVDSQAASCLVSSLHRRKQLPNALCNRTIKAQTSAIRSKSNKRWKLQTQFNFANCKQTNKNSENINRFAFANFRQKRQTKENRKTTK